MKKYLLIQIHIIDHQFPEEELMISKRTKPLWMTQRKDRRCRESQWISSRKIWKGSKHWKLKKHKKSRIWRLKEKKWREGKRNSKTSYWKKLKRTELKKLKTKSKKKLNAYLMLKYNSKTPTKRKSWSLRKKSAKSSKQWCVNIIEIVTQLSWKHSLKRKRMPKSSKKSSKRRRRERRKRSRTRSWQLLGGIKKCMIQRMTEGVYPCQEEMSCLWSIKLWEGKSRSITVQIRDSIEVIVSLPLVELTIWGSHRCLLGILILKKVLELKKLQMTLFRRLKVKLKRLMEVCKDSFQTLGSKSKDKWKMLTVSMRKRNYKDQENYKGKAPEARLDPATLFKPQWSPEKADTNLHK